MKESSQETIYAARLARAYPAMTTHVAAGLGTLLASIERAQHRHAERACNGEDGGYVTYDALKRCRVHDPIAEERARDRVKRSVRKWVEAVSVYGQQPGVELHYDPRGCVLVLTLPNEPVRV